MSCILFFQEKDLIHKLFKVIVPRYENNRSSYTKLYMLPKELPGYGKDMGVLELKGTFVNSNRLSSVCYHMGHTDCYLSSAD